MGSIYSGTGWSKTEVGKCSNGTIYKGTGWDKTPIGEYDNGTIYKDTGWSKTSIGEYDNGTIYKGTGWDKTPIGEYDNGTIYKDTGWSRTPVGEYDGSPAAAAAFLLLFHDGGVSSTESSGSGILGAIFSLIGLIVMAILKIIPYILIYYSIPLLASLTWVFWAAIPFLALGISPIAIVAAVIAGICHITFLPCWIMLFKYRIKKQITTKTMLKYCGKWFLKGPFAYKDMKILKNQINNSISEE